MTTPEKDTPVLNSNRLHALIGTSENRVDMERKLILPELFNYSEVLYYLNRSTLDIQGKPIPIEIRMRLTLYSTYGEALRYRKYKKSTAGLTCCALFLFYRILILELRKQACSQYRSILDPCDHEQHHDLLQMKFSLQLSSHHGLK